MQYLSHLLELIAIFAISGLSLRLLLGHLGLLSLAHAAFMAIGAYTVAILALRWGAPVFLTLPAAIIASFLVAFLLSFPLLRLRGDYFVLATLAVQAIIVNVSKNFEALTNGTQGLVAIPNIGTPHSELSLLIITLSVLALFIVALYRMERSKLGPLLRSVRDNEPLAQAMGQNTPLMLRLSFATTAAIAGLAGGLYSYHINFIDPESFALDESVLLLTIVVLGGVNRMFGAILGAAVLIGLPELLRFLPLPDQVAANSRQMLLGLLLIVFVFVRPSDLQAQEI